MSGRVNPTHSTDQFEDYCEEIESTAAWGGLLEVRGHTTVPVDQFLCLCPSSLTLCSLSSHLLSSYLLSILLHDMCTAQSHFQLAQCLHLSLSSLFPHNPVRGQLLWWENTYFKVMLVEVFCSCTLLETLAPVPATICMSMV